MSSTGKRWKLTPEQCETRRQNTLKLRAQGRLIPGAEAIKRSEATRKALREQLNTTAPKCDVFDCDLRCVRGRGGWGELTSIYCKVHKAMDIRAQGYGTTLKHVIQVWLDNNKECEICQRKLQLRAVNPGERAKSVYMDHDHSTGKFRGVLCHRCNSSIGYLADNREAARRLVAYLERT